MGRTVIADESLLTNLVTIGCKADGRPKANIRWSMQPDGGNRVEVNLTSSDFNESSTRQGRSLLSVSYNGENILGCVTYFCEAENGGPDVVGRIQVCPDRELAEA